MSELINISRSNAPGYSSVRLEKHTIRQMPVVVIALHERCDCRCVMCDIWKIAEPREIALANLQRQLDSFDQLGVRWIALTGGEPQHHSHFAEFAGALRARGIRVTMLTAGLLVEADVAKVADAVDDVIVSLEGPPAVHDRLRRVPGAFTRLSAGIRALKNLRADFSVGVRCTVQRGNHDALCRTIESAQSIGADSVSFLAADLTSTAFNRAQTWSSSRQGGVALDETQLYILEKEIERVIEIYGDSGFVVESPAKLRRIVHHFRAHLHHSLPVAPRCNAPWVSAVVEVGGDVRPCFFHTPIGNINDGTLAAIVNGPEALQFRSQLDVSTNPTCRQCVCSLYIPQLDDSISLQFPVSKQGRSEKRHTKNHAFKSTI